MLDDVASALAHVRELMGGGWLDSLVETSVSASKYSLTKGPLPTAKMAHDHHLGQDCRAAGLELRDPSALPMTELLGVRRLVAFSRMMRLIATHSYWVAQACDRIRDDPEAYLKVLSELTVAATYARSGHDVIPVPAQRHRRMHDLLVRGPRFSGEVEIECKALNPDARTTRATNQTFERISRKMLLLLKTLHVSVLLGLRLHRPIRDCDARHIFQFCREALWAGYSLATLEGMATLRVIYVPHEISWNFRVDPSVPFGDSRALNERAARELFSRFGFSMDEFSQATFEASAVKTSSETGMMRVRSVQALVIQQDPVDRLKAIATNIAEASSQFSGTRPAVIYIQLPGRRISVTDEMAGAARVAGNALRLHPRVSAAVVYRDPFIPVARAARGGTYVEVHNPTPSNSLPVGFTLMAPVAP